MEAHCVGGDGMAECERPQITLIMLGPSERRVNHHGPRYTDGVLDRIICHPIMMVAPDTTVLDSLSFGDLFSRKFL
jgi:hypothetical protein